MPAYSYDSCEHERATCVVDRMQEAGLVGNTSVYKGNRRSIDVLVRSEG